VIAASEQYVARRTSKSIPLTYLQVNLVRSGVCAKEEKLLALSGNDDTMIISEMEVGRMGNKDKTNVMRVLEQKKVPYKGYSFPEVTATNGVEIAEVLGENPDQVFKTLVTCGKTKAYYVFVIPVARELDLKKAAKAVGEKSIAMIPQKELLPLTGYVHGGCSPIGMKKQFPTVFHETARDLPTIYFSAGKIAHQVEVSPADLDKALRFSYADVCVEI
jgi:Cys-tRNA(Pro)/Cys-tRNA(Cys) deacylase